MIGLQRPYFRFALSSGSDAFGRSHGGRCRGNVWDLVADGSLADIGAVLAAYASAGCIDQQVYLTAFNGIHQVRSTVAKLLNLNGINPPIF